MNIPAFPSKQKALMIKSEHIGIASEYEIEHNGMTLRDYFAAKAMQSLLTTINGVVGVNRYEHRVAENALAIADAMLKARKE